MRIALLGYGRMGRAVERAALAAGHEVTHRLDSAEALADALADAQLSPAITDVAIDFSAGGAVVGNLKLLLAVGLPVVIGTTGWAADVEAVEQLVNENHGRVIYGANFSLGVNVFLHLAQQMARLLAPYPSYDVAVTDQHHRHKADAPSGTALKLLNTLIRELPHKSRWVDAGSLGRAPAPEELSVAVTRAGAVPATHGVSFLGPADRLTLTHEAYSRDGFAEGALLAATWVGGLEGLHAFEDMLQQKLGAG